MQRKRLNAQINPVTHLRILACSLLGGVGFLVPLLVQVPTQKY
jgi:hypothetical protein